MKGTLSELIRFSSPLFLSNLSWSVLHLVDTAFVSRLGESALAALGMTMVFDHLFFVSLLSLGIATQILISRERGKGHSDISSVFWTALIGITLLATILGYSALIFLDPLLALFIHDTDVRVLARDYLEIRWYAAPLTGIFVAFRGAYFGTATTLPFSLVILGINMVNAGLDYVLIFGKMGIPPLGIRGAALATVISIGLGIFLLSLYLLRTHRTLGIFRLSIDLSQAKILGKLGLPLFFQYLIAISGWFLFFVFVEKAGRHALSVTTAGTTLLSVLSVLGWALAPMVSTIVSNLLGQHRIQEILQFTRKAVFLSTGIHIVLGGLAGLLAPWIFRIYAEPGTPLMEGLLSIRWNIALIMILFSAGTTIFNALAGTGATILTWISEGISVACYVGFSAIAVFSWHASLPILWLSEAIYWFVLFLTSGSFLTTKLWLRWSPLLSSGRESVMVHEPTESPAGST